MRKLLLSITAVAMIATLAGCKSEKWNAENRREVRDEVKAYRDMVYLENLADEEFNEFSDDVVEAIEIDYPVYTTFVEMPGKGDTIEVYVVSMIVNQLKADAHNMRNIYPYPMLVAEGVLPAGLNGQAQRAFYDCFARKVNNYYKTTDAFFNAVVNDATPTSQITNMQMECAADLFDWGVEVDETIFFD